MNKKGFTTSVIGWIIVLIIIIIGGFLIKTFADTGKPLWTMGDEENSIESAFFSTEYVGTYYDDEFGKTTQNCTKVGSNYECTKGTSVEFYVGIFNKGQKKRYFYPTPCIIKDYAKGDTCESSNYLVSYKPCGVDPAKTGNCEVGRGFILETGKYRIYPGAKCLPDECYDPENPTTNDPKVNYDSFLEITVK